jgi:poly(A) polymerase
VLAAGFPEDQRQKFLLEHAYRRQALSDHIERILQNKPVVTSMHLQSRGISPGKIMGKLLQEAERIAVNENLNDPEQILKKLEISPLWPKQ